MTISSARIKYILDTDIVTYQQLGRVEQRLRIGTNDLRIAAITVAHDASLVTRNLRHFAQVPGLRIETI